MTRKIVQIAIADHQMMVLCDDGTMWHRGYPAGPDHPWFPVPGVPRSVATDAASWVACPEHGPHCIGIGCCCIDKHNGAVP